MKKLKVIIVDDEQGSIQSLKWELELFSADLEIIATFHSPVEAIKGIKKQRPDILFLDIDMPEMSGFDLIRKLEHIDFHIIFATAYDEFAIDAFRISAIDYLLKPIDHTDLKKSIEKIKKLESNLPIQKQLEVLLENVNAQNKSSKKVVFPVLEGLEFMKVSEIVRCQSYSNYTYIYTIDGNSLLISKTLKEVEQTLEGNSFFRIHHSHLINVHFIKKYLKGNAGSIILEDGTRIPVSRSKKGDFLNNL